MAIKRIKRVGTKKCAEGPVKWAHLCELDRRTRPGTPAWVKAHPRWQARKLSVWRALHAVRKHSTIRRFARKKGFTLSSGMQIREMLKLWQKWG